MINSSHKLISHDFESTIGYITGHSKGTVPPCTDQKQFLLTFWPLFPTHRAVESVNKNGIWSIKDNTIPLRCLVKVNCQLEIVGDESVTSSLWRILCEYTFRPLYLSTDVQTY